MVIRTIHCVNLIKQRVSFGVAVELLRLVLFSQFVMEGVETWDVLWESLALSDDLDQIS